MTRINPDDSDLPGEVLPDKLCSWSLWPRISEVCRPKPINPDRLRQVGVL